MRQHEFFLMPKLPAFWLAAVRGRDGNWNWTLKTGCLRTRLDTRLCTRGEAERKEKRKDEDAKDRSTRPPEKV